MGDLISRKNYAIAIQAIAKLNNPNIHYLICGEGPEFNSLQKLTNELNLQSQIHFLGYRTDIITLL
jgi:glycosyltransferase involved in cell wall biosynthesis